MMTADGTRVLAAAEGDRPSLQPRIREDQLASVRQSLSVAIPINQLLCIATLVVAARDGEVQAGIAWFVAASAINLVRYWQSHAATARLAERGPAVVDRQLNVAAMLAAMSGLVWSLTALLTRTPTSPSGVFHMVTAAGITAGSVAVVVANARLSLAFVTPILMAYAASTALASTTEHWILTAAIVLYWVALVRSSLQAEASFCETSRLKHEATSLARSLREAHGRASDIAAEMSHRAWHDSLTGLINRAGFMQELQACCRGPRGECCVLLLDLDGFKSINDTFGHTMGDRVLVEVAERIAAVTPRDQVVARFGGDEFAIAYDPRRSAIGPAELAQRLVRAIGEPFDSFDAGRLGVSIGIARGGEERNPEEMLVFADVALYAAKSAGRNRYCIFDEELGRRLEMRRNTERDLPAAIREGAIEIWYQPIFSDGGRTLGSLEGLVRWNHPRHGWIAPPDIIATAAMAGQSERLFGCIVDAVCAMIGRLRALGMQEVVVAMNVSPREMSQLPIDRLILERLRAAGLPPSSFEIEITEEAALDPRAMKAKLAALSDAGIRIAIDDFGAGYSSLSTLRELHADRLKIDRSLVTGLSSSAENRMLLQAIMSLGQALDLDVVAEGVETADDVLALRALGCRTMQGYHLGRPMPADDIIAYFTKGGQAAVSAA